MNIYYTITVSIVLVICIKINYADALSERMEEKSYLVNQLKKRVLPHISSTSVISNFHNDDLYWIKWLKANSFNVTKASKLFLQNLEWRGKEKIDTIHLEDWSYFQAEYPAYQDTFDIKGRPIIEIWFSEWNIRQAVISGRSRQVIRWLIYNWEMSMRTLFQARAEGFTNVTGAIEIIDYSGINMRTQGCASCVLIYDTFQNAGPLHYPGILEEIYMLNLAQGYKVFISLWRQSLSTDAKNVLKTYGREREWLKILQGFVSADQLSSRFGGAKDRQV